MFLKDFFEKVNFDKNHFKIKIVQMCPKLPSMQREFRLDQFESGYKTFFMLDSTEHVISTAHKNLNAKKIRLFLAFKFSDVVFSMLIMLKCQYSLAF